MQKRRLAVYLMIGIAVYLIAAPAVMAQNFQMPTAKELTATMDEAVDLTDEQEAKVLKMYEDMMSGGMGGGMGMMGGMGGQNPASDILTDAQMEKWTAYQTKQQVDRRINMLDQMLSLTDAQKEKLAPVFEKETVTRNAMMAEMMEQGPNGDFQGMMDKMMEINDATTESLKSILNADQMKTYDDQMSQMGGMGMGGMGMGGMGGGGMGR